MSDKKAFVDDLLSFRLAIGEVSNIGAFYTFEKSLVDSGNLYALWSYWLYLNKFTYYNDIAIDDDASLSRAFTFESLYPANPHGRKFRVSINFNTYDMVVAKPPKRKPVIDFEYQRFVGDSSTMRSTLTSCPVGGYLTSVYTKKISADKVNNVLAGSAESRLGLPVSRKRERANVIALEYFLDNYSEVFIDTFKEKEEDKSEPVSK